MSKKILLLNDSYEVLNFITERRGLKLLWKNKVEIISEWEESIRWIGGKIKSPSILRLKKHVRRNFYSSSFNRTALVKRDNSTCLYCNQKLTASQVTIDHVIPKSQGGATSYMNCVVSCSSCNSKKANRTPEQANLVLLSKPTHPSFYEYHHPMEPKSDWHPNWEKFLL